MDDDRPILPDETGTPAQAALARARAGDLDAFLGIVRPRVGRLLRLASIAAGDVPVAEAAAAAAVRSAWAAARRLDLADLDGALEARLAAALPRRRAGPTGTPLARALVTLRPAERLALARCLDAAPDAAALAVAGRAGVEVEDPAAGGIVDLDGPLAGWDLPRLRSTLAAAAGPLDVDRFLGTLRAGLAGTRPDARGRATLGRLLPGPAPAARGLALVLAAAVGAGTLAWTAAAPDAGPGRAADAAGRSAPGDGTTATDAPRGSGGTAAGEGFDTAGDFPSEVDGLPVVGVNAAKGLARDPAVAGRVIAIRGWMSAPVLAGDCRAPAPTRAGAAGPRGPVGAPAPAAGSVAIDDPLATAAAFCARASVLREAPGTDWGVAHLHPQLLAGTGLGRVRRVFAATGGEPVPVVVLAHFGDPQAELCSAEGRHCGEDLVVDRIAWAGGAPSRPATAVRLPASGGEPTRSASDALSIAVAAYGGLRAVAVAGMPAADLGVVEPEATGAAPAAGYAWLVRAIVEPRAGDPAGAARTWLVVDDRTGDVVAAPGSVAGSGTIPLAGFLFPRRVDGALVRDVADALALVDSGMPEGSAMAVAGWLATPALAGSCVVEAAGVASPLDPAAAFCRRVVMLRGPTPGGPALSLQLPPGTPALPIAGTGAGGGTPVPVVALVQSGSPRSEPCWPTDDGCGRALVLERLLWLAGAPTQVAVAELDGVGVDPPHLTAAEVRGLAETAIGDRGRVVSIVRVPAARRGEVAPGAEGSPVAGDHAWIVRVRSPMIGTGTDPQTRLDLLWWLMVDDVTGRTSTGARSIATRGNPLAPAPPG